MDRDTIRLVLLVIGLFVIAGIYIWGRHKEVILDFFYRRGKYDELEGAQPAGSTIPAGPPPDEDEAEEDSPPPPQRQEPRISEDDFDADEFALSEPAPKPAPAPAPAPPPPRPAAAPAPKTESARTGTLGAPFLIQLSVVAGNGRYFHGEDLRDALLDLDLVYGDMNIFHRYDREYREPLFSIASLVEPGTFPMDAMENFRCPGIVLFFQPGRVPDPLGAYDDLVATSRELARRLNGIEWDEARRPLTDAKVSYMRALLEEACESP